MSSLNTWQILLICFGVLILAVIIVVIVIASIPWSKKEARGEGKEGKRGEGRGTAGGWGTVGGGGTVQVGEEPYPSLSSQSSLLPRRKNRDYWSEGGYGGLTLQDPELEKSVKNEQDRVASRHKWLNELGQWARNQMTPEESNAVAKQIDQYVGILAEKKGLPKMDAARSYQNLPEREQLLQKYEAYLQAEDESGDVFAG